MLWADSRERLRENVPSYGSFTFCRQSRRKTPECVSVTFQPSTLDTCLWSCFCSLTGRTRALAGKPRGSLTKSFAEIGETAMERPVPCSDES